MPFFVYGNNGNDFTSPPFPSGDISIPNGISAIGTKFDKAENQGPESQKEQGRFCGSAMSFILISGK